MYDNHINRTHSRWFDASAFPVSTSIPISAHMSTHTSRTLGVIGLGSMGMGAACSAVRQGTPTWGFDPRSEALAAFGEAGGHPAGSVAELAAKCDVVLVLVVNAAQTEQVLFGAGGLAEHLKPGSVVITSPVAAWRSGSKWGQISRSLTTVTPRRFPLRCRAHRDTRRSVPRRLTASRTAQPVPGLRPAAEPRDRHR